MRLNPTAPGVEPFLNALQAATDASASSGAAPMETDDKPSAKKDDDKMDES